MSEEELRKLFGSIRENFSLSDDVFISFESAPYVLSESKLELLRELGATRLSV